MSKKTSGVVLEEAIILGEEEEVNGCKIHKSFLGPLFFYNRVEARRGEVDLDEALNLYF